MAKGAGNKNVCALYRQIFSSGKSEGTEPRGLANPGSAVKTKATTKKSKHSRQSAD